ncbi:MAG: hypothetical protein ACR2MD_06900 [Aridibacter sp.]
MKLCPIGASLILAAAFIIPALTLIAIYKFINKINRLIDKDISGG